MAYSEDLPTGLNLLAERTCFSQVGGTGSNLHCTWTLSCPSNLGDVVSKLSITFELFASCRRRYTTVRAHQGRFSDLSVFP
jgi:hypothetical protein